MIIAIEESLEELKNYLQQKTPYECYTLGAYEGAVDVIIYDKQYSNEAFNTYQYESTQEAIAKVSDISQGTLIIHAHHQTPEQIVCMIKAHA